ncbi:MAG: translocation/assembly module TamB domain-containing protein [Alphaproteobacteria bacterium]|nr:translocation/assembly module TamB domain-containing protein [Alphaproteobacteria bacterium]
MALELKTKWGKRAGRLVLWLVAVLFLFAFLVQIAIWGGVAWLNGPQGQAFVQSKISEALAESGYVLSVDGFSYRPLTGIGLGSLEVSDQDGLIASLKDVRLHAGIFPLAARHLSLSLWVDTVTLNRLPKGADKAPDETPGMAPFSLPDLYFHSVSLSDIAIEHVSLAPSVAGKDIAFSPTLTGRIMLQSHRATGKLFLGLEDVAIEGMDDKTIALLPSDLAFSGTLEADAPRVVIDSLQIKGKGYGLKANGDFTLDQSRLANLAVRFNVPDLAVLAPGQGGSFDVSTDITGAIDSLAAKGGGSVLLDALSDAGLSAVDFSFDADGLTDLPKGTLSLGTMRGEESIGLDTQFAVKDGGLILDDLKGHGPQFAFSGGHVAAGADGVKAQISGVNVPGTKFKNFALDLTKVEAGYRLVSSLEGALDRGYKANISADVTPAQRLENIDASLKSGKSAVHILGAADAKTLDLTVSAKQFALADSPVTLPAPLPGLLVSLQASLNGPLAAPVADIQTTIVPIENKQIKIGSSAHYEADAARVSFNVSGQGIKDLSGEAQLPVKLSLSPFVMDAGAGTALDGHFNGNLDGKALVAALLPGNSFSGIIKTSGTLGGTIGTPQVSAKLGLKDVTFSLQNDMVRGQADADLAFENGHENGFKLSGNITTQQIDVTLPERFGQSIPSLNVETVGQKSAAQSGTNIALDVAFKAPQRVFVRGWGLDAELGGAIDITGTAATPLFDGALKLIRGRYSEFGKRFTISKADMLFTGTIPPSPSLDMVAETKAGDVTAQVNIGGNAQTPKITFSSVPSLPEDEVLSRILFGQDMSKISPFQAVQLAQTLARFSGAGGGAASFDPLGMLRDGTGLDDLRVETGEDGAASVGAGKYLSDNVYLELEGGTEESSGAASVQIELTPNITVESKIGQDAQGGAGVFWKKDY